jgi:hypothetical protein
MGKGEIGEWGLCSGVLGDSDRETIIFLTFTG